MAHDFLKYKNNIFSQNGEDGVIREIFNRIGVESKLCCEFGAWDGIHLSNVRNLILSGWSGIMIEGDKDRFVQLQKTYQDNHNVYCINAYVDDDRNKLSKLIRGLPVAESTSMDFLSIDIDGLDYNIFASLDFQPRVICVEVNAGHDPQNPDNLDWKTAIHNVGQPLSAFTELALKKGYELICYTGNAFFGRQDVLRKHNIEGLSAKAAYKNFLAALTTAEKEWLLLVNAGWVEPYFKFNNHYLDPKELGISNLRLMALKMRYVSSYLKSAFSRLR